MATTTTITASKDTWLNQGGGTINYGTSTTFRLGSADRYGIIQKNNGVFSFDVSSITDVSTITKAELTFEYVSTVVGTSVVHEVTVARLNEDFSESNATWNVSDTVAWTGGIGAWGNAETTQATYTFDVGNNETADKTIDIKELVIDAVNRRSGTLLLVVSVVGSVSGTGQTNYASAEHATKTFSLVITQAERIVWSGGAGDGNTATSANWVGATVPTVYDHAIFNSGSADVTSGTVIASKVYIGQGYSGSLGASGSLLDVLTYDLHIDNSRSAIYLDVATTTPVCKVRLHDCNSSGNFELAGYYTAVVQRTRHTALLTTTNVTEIDVGRGASIQCSDSVADIRVSGGRAILKDSGGNITANNRANIEISVDDTDDANLTIAGNSTVKFLGSALDTVKIYNGLLRLRGNEEAVIQFSINVYSDGIADTRTDSATYAGGTGPNNLYGGRILFDGSQLISIG